MPQRINYPYWSHLVPVVIQQVSKCKDIPIMCRITNYKVKTMSLLMQSMKNYKLMGTYC